MCGQISTGGRGCPNRWCRRADRGFSVAFSVGVYQGALRRAIGRFKYQGQVDLAPVFGDMVASYLTAHPTWFEDFDVITAVPSYTGAGARRTWDPIGSVLARVSDRLPACWEVEPGLLVKTRETAGMAGLGWAERQAVARDQLRPALRVAEGRLVDGARVLVLDDVLTDGSTLREVARVLLRAGATEVAGLVLARPAWVGGDVGAPDRALPRPQPGVSSARPGGSRAGLAGSGSASRSLGCSP